MTAGVIKRGPWAAGELAAVRRLAAAGRSDAEIGAELGRTARAVEGKRLAAGRAAPAGGRFRWTPQRLAKLRAFYARREWPPGGIKAWAPGALRCSACTAMKKAARLGLAAPREAPAGPDLSRVARPPADPPGAEGALTARCRQLAQDLKACGGGEVFLSVLRQERGLSPAGAEDAARRAPLWFRLEGAGTRWARVGLTAEGEARLLGAWR